MYFKDIKSFFNFDNLEPAPGRPASLFLVLLPPILELDVLEQAPDCQNKKKLYSRAVYTDMFSDFLNVNLSFFKKTKF